MSLPRTNGVARTPLARLLTVTPLPARSANPPSVTVAICTRDRPSELAHCLDLLATSPATEVLVVDSGPSDDAARPVCAAAKARYVLEPEPGLSRARNVAWQQAGTEIVAYLDDDARPQPEWLPALVCPFEDPSVMAVTGQILPPIFHSAGTEEFRLDTDAPEWQERALFGGAGSGANMAFRRSFLEQYGGFDERLGRGRILDGGEEHDAFYRVVKSGLTLAYVPGAVVTHPDDPAGPSDPRTRVAFAIHLFVKYPALRGWLVRRTLRVGLGSPRTSQVHPSARRRSVIERLRIAAGGCGVYLRNRWAGNAVEAAQPQRCDP